jgi:ATP diphosphatase
VSIDRLRNIMARLRDPEHGCPWDREQTWSTIAPHTIEEAYELADAIQRGDRDEVRDELGDLLFQVVFQSRIAEEQGLFTLDDVADAISDKLERRHPHVFGDAEVRSVAEQSTAWESHKASERRARGQGEGALDGVAVTLPALTRAAKLGKRAARVGFDWTRASEVLAKVDEECRELQQSMASGEDVRIHDELGDLLFAVAQLARHLGADPEQALRAGNAKFERRFRWIEARLAGQGRSPSEAGPDELETLWARAKQDIG